MRKWLLATLVAIALGIFVVALVYRQQRIHDREALDMYIAAAMNQPIEECLRLAPEKDAVFALAGEFQSWQPSDHGRMPRMDWRPPYVTIQGTAKFEKADVLVSVSIYRGPLEVKLQSQDTAQWLAQQ